LEEKLAMSIFVFDKDTTDILRYILAIKRFKDYSVGPKGIELHLCTLALKRVLIHTGLNYPKFQKENPTDLKTHDIIRFLADKKLVNPTVANQLTEYLTLHVTLMRTGAQVTSETAHNKADELLRFLCAEAKIDVEKELREKEFEDIANLKAGQPLMCEIDEPDFDALDKLYDKCTFIQKEIEKKLTVPLKPAKISGFTPNTGGIWIPFVSKGASEKRGHLDGAYLGVTFTPISIRIGLNFGAQAHKHRNKYYDLLLNGNLSGEIEALSRRATGYCLCDTYWHYHIRNIQSLQWCLTLYGSTRLAFENAIEETKQQEGKPLTAHRYLISKVIERRPEDFTYIVKGIVNEAAMDLNELYPVLALIVEAQGA
jgi:hypothetical protein